MPSASLTLCTLPKPFSSLRKSLGFCPQSRILDGIIKGKMIAFGAFDKGTVIGFVVIGTEFFGSINQYLQLIEFEVSYPYRGKGIG